MTISSLINAFQKTFGGVKRNKSIPALTHFDDDGCPKCGSMKFSYDSYWNESCCQECGWIIQREKKDHKKRTQTFTQSDESPNIHGRIASTADLEFSYSKISLFEKCPKAYHFKYILKKDELFSTIEQHLGKSIHYVLNDIYEKKYNGINVSIDSLIKAFDHTWNSPEIEKAKVVKNKMTSRDYYLDGKNMLKKYYFRVFESDRSETVALEKYFIFNIENSINYRGYIDRISKQSNGMLRITDFKSGKRVNNPTEDLQLCSYALWLFEEFEENEIEIVFEALRHEKTMHSRIKRTQVPIIKKRLLADIKSIMAATEFEARHSILCKWCGYKPICGQDRGASKYGYKNNEDVSSGSYECPWCGSDLEERDGRYGTFIGCTEFPMCRYTRENW